MKRSPFLTRVVLLAVLLAVPKLEAATLEAGSVIESLSLEIEKSLALSVEPSYLAQAEDPATEWLRQVQVRPGALELGLDAIRLSLAPGLKLKARRTASYRTGSGSLVWTGILSSRQASAEIQPFDTVNLVLNDGKLTGNVHFRGDWYKIRPVGDGDHVVVKVNRAMLPPDHGSDAPQWSAGPALDSQEGVAQKANTMITALVNYTAAAAAASGDINGLIDLAELETNQGYAASGVAITLQIVKRAQTTYTESGNSLTDLTRYRSTNDNQMDYIHTARNQLGADVAVLLIGNFEACGRAYFHANASSAFGVVRWDCATGNYSFGHEIGHILSAHHDPATDTNTVYPYGHGYVRATSPVFRTIMAYPQGTIPRVNYWSSPLRSYLGVPMGTASKHDNARVLNNRRATVAGFRTASGCVPDGGLDDTLGVTSCCSNAAVNGSTYCTNPADWNNGWASCTHICRSALVGGCIPSGGIDDIWSSTSCCSGASVPGSAFCNDPADYGDDWATCAQICL